MPAVRASIDSGHPCPLALVRVHSANPADLGHNHQVLAYGYEDAGPTTTVRIYDPNCPNDDGVTITFDTSHPEHTTDFTHSRDASPAILGFFADAVRAAQPVAAVLEHHHVGHPPGCRVRRRRVWRQRLGGRHHPAARRLRDLPAGTAAGWDGVDGGAVRIAVAPDGSPWVVNDAGAIVQRVGNQWQEVPGAAAWWAPTARTCTGRTDSGTDRRKRHADRGHGQGHAVGGQRRRHHRRTQLTARRRRRTLPGGQPGNHCSDAVGVICALCVDPSWPTQVTVSGLPADAGS